MLSEDDVTAILINPIYAVSINPDLAGSHEPIVSKKALDRGQREAHQRDRRRRMARSAPDRP